MKKHQWCHFRKFMVYCRLYKCGKDQKDKKTELCLFLEKRTVPVSLLKIEI